MPNIEVEGYVLHRMPYRETSLLIDVFSESMGIVRGVAKGVRGSKTDRKSLLQPFQPLVVSVSGRHELKNFGRVEAKGAALNLVHNSLFCGFYVNELLNRALPKGLPAEDLYHHYFPMLEALASFPVDAKVADFEPLLRTFELLLLDETGYLPDFSHCADSGQPIRRESVYQFVVEGGFCESKLQTAVHSDYFFGYELMKIAQQQWDQQSLPAAKRLMRLALPAVIGAKPLNSRTLFTGVR